MENFKLHQILFRILFFQCTDLLKENFENRHIQNGLWSENKRAVLFFSESKQQIKGYCGKTTLQRIIQEQIPTEKVKAIQKLI